MSQTIIDLLKCPGCRNVYTDPVLIQCNHTICRDCVRGRCPVCATKLANEDYPSNTLIADLIRTMIHEAEEKNRIAEEKLKLSNIIEEIDSIIELINTDLTQIEAAYKAKVANTDKTGFAEFEKHYRYITCSAPSSLNEIQLIRAKCVKQSPNIKEIEDDMLNFDSSRTVQRYKYSPHKLIYKNIPNPGCDDGGIDEKLNKSYGLLASNEIKLASLHPIGGCGCLHNLPITLKKTLEVDDTLIEYMSKYRNSYIRITFAKPANLECVRITSNVSNCEVNVKYTGNEIVTEKMPTFGNARMYQSIKAISYVKKINIAVSVDGNYHVENVAILAITIFGSL